MLTEEQILALPSVTEILRDAGISYDYAGLPEIYRERGTAVHDLCDKSLKGEHIDYDTIPIDFRGYFNAFTLFRGESEIKIILAEKNIYHPYYLFRGRPDLICYLDGYPTIVDYKTGTVPMSAGIQTAGYEVLVRWLYPEIKHWRRIAVRLMENEKYILKAYDSRTDMAEFMAALKNYMESRGIKWITTA